MMFWLAFEIIHLIQNVSFTAAPPPPFPGDFKCGRTNVQQNRVVNGFDAKEGAWPWLGSLQNDGNHWCGATLITPTWVSKETHFYIRWIL